MQRLITEYVHLGQTIDTNNQTGKVKSVDISSNFNEIKKILAKLQTFLKKGIFDRDVLD